MKNTKMDAMLSQQYVITISEKTQEEDIDKIG